MVVANKSKYNAVDGFTAYRVPDADSYSALFGKQKDVFVRAYFEFLNVQKLRGCVYFYTFTFNDANLCFPSLDYIKSHNEFNPLGGFIFDDNRSYSPVDVPCIDNSRFRDFYNGMFRKKLLNQYGCTFKYICATEFGDGKGERGAGFNPHFHVLFYVYPNEGYDVPNALEFKRLVQEFWQGVDSNGNLLQDPQTFVNGIARESNIDYGLVNSPSAICYVTKYVGKDMVANSKVDYIESYFKRQIFTYFFNDLDTRISYCRSLGCLTLDSRLSDDLTFIDILNIYSDAGKFNQYCNNLARDVYVVYFRKLIRRLYLPKVFISKGLGACAYEHLSNDYKFVVPFGKNLCSIKLPLYYYRKFMCDRITIDNQVTYVPNLQGIKYRSYCFRQTLQESSSRYCCYLHTLGDFPLSDIMTDSPIHNRLITQGYEQYKSLKPTDYVKFCDLLSCIANFYSFYASDFQGFLSDIDGVVNLYSNVLAQRGDYLSLVSENPKPVRQSKPYPRHELHPLAYLLSTVDGYFMKCRDKYYYSEFEKRKLTRLYHFQK